jgi:mannose-P-dolichol utilization defect protein 1
MALISEASTTTPAHLKSPWEECVRVALSDSTWSDGYGHFIGASCHWLALSKVLSYGVIAGAMVGKLPQVYKVWHARSAEGVSRLSIFAEMTYNGVQFSYNVVLRTPLSTYGEFPITFFQLLLLNVVVVWCNRCKDTQILYSCLGLVLLTFGMASGTVPIFITAALYTAGAGFSLAAFGPQIWMNFKRKSAGQLSFVVTAMNFSGCSTRCFTTWYEVDHSTLRAMSLLNWIMAGTLVAQFWVYRSANIKKSDVATTEIQLCV